MQTFARCPTLLKKTGNFGNDQAQINIGATTSVAFILSEENSHRFFDRFVKKLEECAKLYSAARLFLTTYRSIFIYECSEQFGSLGTVCLALLDIDDPQACDVSIFFYWTRSPLGLFRIIRKEMNKTKRLQEKNILMAPFKIILNVFYRPVFYQQCMSNNVG